MSAASAASLDDAWQRFCNNFEKYFSRLSCSTVVDNITSQGTNGLPNILIYSAGFPLQLVWGLILHKLFGWSHKDSSDKVWDKDLLYRESVHHFEIDFGNPTQTKNVEKITAFVKEIVTHTCIHDKRHIIILSNVDAVATNKSCATQMLRVLFERYSNNVLFISTTSRLSSLEKPLVSRFLAVRVPLFDNETIKEILVDIGLPHVDMNVLPIQHRRDLPYILYRAWLQECGKSPQHGDLKYEFLHDYFVTTPTCDQLRSLTQKLHNIDASIQHITLDLMTICNDNKRHEVLALGAEIDSLLARTESSRKPLYIEYFLNAVVNLGAF